jgi:MFS family permease
MPFFFRGAIGEALKHSSLSYPINLFSVLGGAVALVLGLLLAVWVSPFTGRRWPIIIGLVIAGISAYISSISSSLEAICSNFFLSFFGCGLSVSAAVALTLETFPSKLSGFAIALLASFYLAGQFFVTVSATVLNPKEYCAPLESELCGLQFRLELVSVPTVLAALTSILFLKESPFALTDDCYALNHLVSQMDTGRTAIFKFSPGPSSTQNIFLTRKSLGVSEIIFGLILGSTLTLICSYGTTGVSGISFLGTLVFLLALGSVPIGNPRIAAMALPFVLMLVMSCELVIGNHFSLEILARSLALGCMVMIFRGFEGWADRLALAAAVIGVGEIVSVGWPLFVNLHAETEETAFAIVFGLTGVVAVLLLPAKPAEFESIGKSPQFNKIPIIPYGTIKLNS